MEYGIWKYREGQLLVEKYIGIIDYETILKMDLNLFEGVKESFSELKILTDVSQASFSGINTEEIKKLVDYAVESTRFVPSVKGAFYTGSNNYEDFQKIMSYARYAAQKFYTTIPFNFLDTALEWLELSSDEIKEVKSDLASLKI